MADVVNDKYVVALQWDPLFGIEREAREIRSLIKAREATHYVVLTGEMGAKSIGLAQLPTGVEGEPGYLALLPLVAQKFDSKDFLFIHPHPNAEGKFIVFGMREGRPTLDKVVDEGAAESVVHEFLKERTTAAVVSLGDWPDAPEDFTLDQTVSLDELIEATTASAAQAVTMTSAKASGVRINKKWIASIVLLSVLAAAGFYGYQWYEESQVVEEDPVEVYVETVSRTFRTQTAKGGAAYAEAIHTLIAGLTVNAAGWQLQSIDCSGTSCRLVRTRDIGAEIDPIVTADATIELKEVPIARETVRLDLVQAPRDIRLVSLKTFYELSLARLMRLADYGLTPKVEPPTDLVELPGGVSRNDIPEASRIQRGTWSLSGNLAFLDSMTAIVQRAENMVVDKVAVDLKTMRPTFTASGFYYVR